MTGYYAYEYEVLMKLQDKYKIKSVEITKETQEVRKTVRDTDGRLKDVVVAKVDAKNTEIKLCFENDFEIRLFREIDIQSGFMKGFDTDYVVSHIGTMIDNQWLNRIKK